MLRNLLLLLLLLHHWLLLLLWLLLLSVTHLLSRHHWLLCLSHRLLAGSSRCGRPGQLAHPPKKTPHESRLGGCGWRRCWSRLLLLLLLLLHSRHHLLLARDYRAVVHEG